MARKINSRQPKKPQRRVIGAGITEFWYLKHLKPLLKLKYDLKPRYFGDESMNNINKLIEQGLSENAEVVCFYDEDVKDWNAKESQLIEDLHNKYDKDVRVTLACSKPSIEYWFLLHFEKTNRHLRTSNDAISALRKYIEQFDKKEKFLKYDKWVSDLIKDGKMDDAMQRAEELGRSGDSYSDVWKAMKVIKKTDSN